MSAADLRAGGARLPIATTSGDLSTSECGRKKHRLSHGGRGLL